ncbi:hypothetical protein MYP_4905 [Sporocytophaga myxococcoides]|uniref:Uncharacterized protein n=1 Tax=Sporocytophaga myxococcoides TaxID=153721 RepID=A0A098LL12_9BACT|nr:hypothetical protein MYP_4905 [Sporocytophaga myxococcoides]
MCDTLVTTYRIPEEFQGKYHYKVEVLKSDTSQQLVIKYLLESAETEVIKEITTDLKKYFSSSIPSSAADANLRWIVVHNIYIDGQLKSTQLTMGWPYNPCYTLKSDCKEVIVFRKRLEDICPAADVYPKPFVKIVNDSILVNFKNVIKPRNVTCKALGTEVVTDSIVLSKLSQLEFMIFHADTQIVYCVNAPCPPRIEMTKIGTADLRNCLPDKNENVFEGSFLCKNLSANLNLPKNLQGNYSYTYKVEFVKNTLVIDYYLTQDRADWLEKINISLNDVFLPENVIKDNRLAEVPVIQNVHLNGNLYVIKGFGQPVNRCFEYKTDCNKITLYRRYLHAICSSQDIYTKLTYRIEEEKGAIFASLSDSIVFSEIVCLAVGNVIKSDSIEITNMKDLKYELQVNEVRNYHGELIYKAPDYYTWSSKVELNECVIAGTDKVETVNNNPWPNPCTTDIHLKGHEGKIIFTNQVGQLFVIGGNEVFNVSDLPRGIYIITYEKDGLTRREKVVLK